MSHAARTSQAVRAAGLADCGSTQRELPQLVFVAGSRSDHFGEDGGIGGDADDLAIVDHLGEVARLDQQPAEVVQPNADSFLRKVL
jgi:hypothetical protein